MPIQNGFSKFLGRAGSQIYDYFSARDLVNKEKYVVHLKGELQPEIPQLGLMYSEAGRYCKKISFLLGKLPNVLDLMWLLFARNMDFDTNTTLLGLVPIEFTRAFARSLIHTRQSSQQSELVRRMNSMLIPVEELVSANGEFGYGHDDWKK